MLKLVAVLAVFSSIIGLGFSDDCFSCQSLLLKSSGNFSTTWPIFHHHWTQNGKYDGMPKYWCEECFGTRRELIWDVNRWSIVDCLPNQTDACFGSHEIVYSPNVGKGICLWDVQGTWHYCTEGLTNQGCVSYGEDNTVRFQCN